MQETETTDEIVQERAGKDRKSSIVETSHRNSDVLDICHTDRAICDGYELHSNTRTACTINTAYRQVNFVEKREVEKGITLEHLSKNLNQIREDGFSKLSRLVKNLNSEKHCYLQNIDEVSRAIDEHISGIKYDIDAVHLDMKNKLKEMRSKMSRKIQQEMELYKKHVRDMNVLVQKGIEAFQTKSDDHQLLFQLNSDIQDKMNYLKSLNIEILMPPPIFKRGTYTKDDIVRVIGTIKVQRSKTFGHHQSSSHVGITESGRMLASGTQRVNNGQTNTNQFVDD